MSLTFAVGQGVGSSVRYMGHRNMIRGFTTFRPMASSKFNIGDRVRFSSNFLRSICAYTGPMGQLRGTIKELKKYSGNNLYAEVEWDQMYFEDKTTFVNTFNLQQVKKP